MLIWCLESDVATNLGLQVRNVTGTCAGDDGCPLCVLTAIDGDGGYPSGFPGRNVNPACNITRAKKALL